MGKLGVWWAGKVCGGEARCAVGRLGVRWGG